MLTVWGWAEKWHYVATYRHVQELIEDIKLARREIIILPLLQTPLNLISHTLESNRMPPSNLTGMAWLRSKNQKHIQNEVFEL